MRLRVCFTCSRKQSYRTSRLECSKMKRREFKKKLEIATQPAVSMPPSRFRKKKKKMDGRTGKMTSGSPITCLISSKVSSHVCVCRCRGDTSVVRTPFGHAVPFLHSKQVTHTWLIYDFGISDFFGPKFANMADGVVAVSQPNDGPQEVSLILLLESPCNGRWMSSTQ